MKDTQIELATLTGAPDLQAAFERYRLGWTAHPTESYFPKIVREFYALYATSI